MCGMIKWVQDFCGLGSESEKIKGTPVRILRKVKKSKHKGQDSSNGRQYKNCWSTPNPLKWSPNYPDGHVSGSDDDDFTACSTFPAVWPKPENRVGNGKHEQKLVPVTLVLVANDEDDSPLVVGAIKFEDEAGVLHTISPTDAWDIAKEYSRRKDQLSKYSNKDIMGYILRVLKRRGISGMSSSIKKSPMPGLCPFLDMGFGFCTKVGGHLSQEPKMRIVALLLYINLSPMVMVMPHGDV
ncbi:unnamed protein product [Notodromas monacha]|uniref:Uncharacterized protein n=1 Tax=Notodromas monacha TaxID=399045 RepID=A0A7R9GFN6_9CRUS|nr:unnamed protein product [Notodromas monacha]CAG0920867.1 unnamed protein product [Notodromas monacha]